MNRFSVDDKWLLRRVDAINGPAALRISGSGLATSPEGCSEAGSVRRRRHHPEGNRGG